VDGFVVHEVAADVAVRVVRQMPDLPRALDQEVERLWQAACERAATDGAGRLFNGRVFSVDRFAADLITGHLTEFRRIVAQMESRHCSRSSACGRSRYVEYCVARTAWW